MLNVVGGSSGILPPSIPASTSGSSLGGAALAVVDEMHIVNGTPVAGHKSLEAQLSLQESLQRVAVAAGKRPIDAIV
jgi:hypothetical protein